MDIQKRITSLWNIDDEGLRNKGIKLVTKVYGNILKQPNNNKYHNLNFSKIRKVTQNCKPALYLLFSAGFHQNIDGSRLVLDTNNILCMKMLKEANETFLNAVANGGPIIPKQEEINNSKDKPAVKNDKDDDEAMKDKDKNGDNNNNSNNDKNEKNDKGSTLTEKEQLLLNDGLNADELDLLEQIKKNKDTTVTLSMDELKGRTKEEKQKIFKQKQEQYRKEKKQSEIKNKLNKEHQRRNNIKNAQDAERKRKETELKKIAEQKKREKDMIKLRKKNIKEKIAADKARRKREKELREQAKQQQNP